MIIQEIEKEILNLKPIDKIHIAEMIFESLDKPDPEIEKLWVGESENRYNAYKNDKIQGIPLSKIKVKYEE